MGLKKEMMLAYRFYKYKTLFIMPNKTLFWLVDGAENRDDLVKTAVSQAAAFIESTKI